MKNRNQQANTASSLSSASAASAAALPPPLVVRRPATVQLVGHFSSIPSEIFINNILAPLDVRDQRHVARTCRRMYFFCENFDELSLMHYLAHYIVAEPNPAKVIAIIRARPQLLQSKINKVRVNGVSIRGYTPFQLAYGAGDIAAIEGEMGMCEVLKDEWVRFLGNEEAALTEIQRQIAEKKLNVIDQEKDDLIKNTFASALAYVIQAIGNEQFNLGRDAENKLILNPATLAAIATFRAAFIELQPTVVEEGMHFRSNTVQETFDVYAQAAATWGYDYNKCALFEDGALSFVLLSCMPVNDKQRLFGQGYYYLYEQARKESFERRMLVRGSNINFDDCLRSDSRDFSGLSGSCINIFTARADGRAHDDLPIRVDRVSKLMSNKNTELAKLMQPSRSAPAARPIVY